MAQSIKARLNGQRGEFLADVERLGTWNAMEKWNFSRYSYPRVQEIIVEETNDENFGKHPTIDSYRIHGLENFLQEFVVAFANYAIRTNKRLELQQGELEAHKHNATIQEQNAVDMLGGLMEMLK